MKLNRVLVINLLLLYTVHTQGQAYRLKCEYLINPIGIDAPSPRLHWQMNDSTAGAMQTAYQVIVGTDSFQVANGIGNCWDTKKISNPGMLVSYKGQALKPFTKYLCAGRQPVRRAQRRAAGTVELRPPQCARCGHPPANRRAVGP